MGSVTIRVRSLVWFVTGAMLAAAVTLMYVTAWRADAAPGDADTTRVAIAPCRLADLRPPNTPALVSGETRSFQVHGSNGDCNIPTDAVAVSMNVTATDATAATFLTLWAADEPQPLASSLNPFPGQPPTPNAVTTPLSATGAFNIFNFTGSVAVFFDIDGYYTKSSLTELASRVAANEANIASNTGNIASNTGNIASNTGNIASNTGNIAANTASRPFTVASTPIVSVAAGSTATEIRSVTAQAPVAGRVAVVASGYMDEPTDGQFVECGLMDSVTDPPVAVELFWESATTDGSFAHVSASRVFDIAADATATYSLVCRNTSSGGSSIIHSPQVTAIFTPAP